METGEPAAAVGEESEARRRRRQARERRKAFENSWNSVLQWRVLHRWVVEPFFRGFVMGFVGQARDHLLTRAGL